MALVFLSLLTGSFITRFYFKETFESEVKSQIKHSLEDLKKIVVKSNLPKEKLCTFITDHESSARFSLIEGNGTVVCDNFANATTMDNHSNREEIKALENSTYGVSTRKSSTLDFMMVYGAMKIEVDGSGYILRKALPLKQIGRTFSIIDRSILIIILPLFFLLAFFSIRSSMRFTEPLRDLLIKLRSLGRKNSDSTEIVVENEEFENLDSAFEEVKKELTDYIKTLHLENEKNAVLIRSISDGILAVDNNNKILFMNQNFKESFLPTYVESKSKLVDSYAWDLIRNIQIENAYNLVLEDPDYDHENEEINIEILKRNNQKGFYDLIVSPLKGVSGENIGVIGIFRDETGSRLTDQMRTDFVTNVSHEVRTPLTAMKGFIQIIAANSDDIKPEIHNYLERIEQNCDRLIRLFNDVLNLSVINSKAIVDRDEIIPTELVNSVVTNVRQSYREKGIEVEKDVSSQVFYGESLLIEQVVTNLVDNAFKYNIKQGKIKISWWDDEKNSYISVEDTGIGIKEKHYPRLFERFYRIDPSRSREMGGTGLGLAIVKHIILKHSGKIEIEKSKLGGSRFFVTLPISKKQQKKVAPKSKASQ